jgi:acetyltransferase-like isoleucine patch superfamily enzyme
LSDKLENTCYPDRESLVDRPWLFKHESGVVAAEALRLGEDGSIIDYAHVHEASWRIEDGKLVFVAVDGRVSTRFEEAISTRETLILRGQFLLEPERNIVLRLERPVWNYGLPDFGSQTKYQFPDQIRDLGWAIGDHTYGRPRVYHQGSERLLIGKYCAIGEEVTIILAGHRPDYVSIYPFAQFRGLWRSVPQAATDHRGKGDIVIGNDVWLGHAALIAAGVKIGNGAVVGSHAVVTHDVPPYAIVAGNPARLIRYRFDEESIAALLDIAWWNWPDEKVDRHLPMILSDDIGTFIRHARRLQSQ